jgi:pyruvate carboxylase subunit B
LHEPTLAGISIGRNPAKGVDACRKMLVDAGITDLSDENLLIAATCQEQGIQFLKGEASVGVPLKNKK